MANDVGEGQVFARRKRFLRMAAYLVIYTCGALLFFGGFSFAVWLTRPYLTLYLSSAQREALEKKIQLNRVDENRIIIPSVLVDAPISAEFSEKALRQGVVHVPGSSYPGQDGNTILEGHNYAWFTRGYQESFTLLHLIKRGAEIYVYYGGKKYSYRVAGKKTLEVNDPRLYAVTSYRQLTLITCASSWSVSGISPTKRVVVTAELE